MIEPIAELPDNVIGFEAKGEVTKDDYVQRLIPALEAALEKHEKVRFLYVLGSDFTGYSGERDVGGQQVRHGAPHQVGARRCGLGSRVDPPRRQRSRLPDPRRGQGLQTRRAQRRHRMGDVVSSSPSREQVPVVP